MYRRRRKAVTTITRGHVISPPVFRRGDIVSSPFEFGKQVSVYGTAYANGRYETRRYEFIGSGRNLYRAVRESVRHPPKTRFLRIRAEYFVANPYLFESRGYWFEKEVES